MRTRNIFIFLIIVVIFLWLFLSKGESDELKTQPVVSQETNSSLERTNLSSAIEPIKIIEIEDNADLRQINNDDRRVIQTQFKKATEYLLKEEWGEAENLYLEVIKKAPLAIESYINLASLYVQTDRLDDARKVLIQGVDSNKNYSVLFKNLQSIHGALAAKAYQAAFASEEDIVSLDKNIVANLDLQLINSIDLRLVDLNRQQGLTKQIIKLIKSQREGKEYQEKSDLRIVELETQLAEIDTKRLSLSDDSINRISELEEKIQQQETELQLKTQEITLAKNELIAFQQQAATELATAQSLASVATTSIAQNTQSNNSEVPVVQQTPASINELSNQPSNQPRNELSDQEKNDVASKLLESWANSWSKQDVDGYISHYVESYSPPRTKLTHSQWVDQREVRLTNKKFIQVDVSDLEFQQGENQFSIVFTQRYRSNTIDDTIRKQLIFKSNAADLGSSKIMDELVITN